MHIAAWYGHVDVVKMLLECERFTEVNAKDKVRNTLQYNLCVRIKRDRDEFVSYHCDFGHDER